MNSELGEVVVASTVRDGDREFGVEIADPRQDAMTQDWHCTYRVAGTRTHRVRGPDRLSAVYAALIDIHSATARFGSPDNADDPHRPREPVAARPRIGGAPAAHAREFGPPLGARAVDTAAGPVVIVLGRPRRDPYSPHTCLCPFRIDDRTEAFGQGFDDLHAVLSAIRGVSAILGIPQDWPAPGGRGSGLSAPVRKGEARSPRHAAHQ
ncbi:hypothetical protein ATM97_22695 [Nocardia sp. MH4]|uniref:hypothetical protein n=1 Tax=Nocardia TaxID=1817 RepID=UPI001C4FB5B1|nr:MULTISPECIES: hypothetical protein [Nocardia]MBW0272899.1 hypothetical protein [Nocardia sp. MH4]